MFNFSYKIKKSDQKLIEGLIMDGTVPLETMVNHAGAIYRDGYLDGMASMICGCLGGLGLTIGIMFLKDKAGIGLKYDEKIK